MFHIFAVTKVKISHFCGSFSKSFFNLTAMWDAVLLGHFHSGTFISGFNCQLVSLPLLLNSYHFCSSQSEKPQSFFQHTSWSYSMFCNKHPFTAVETGLQS